MDGDIDFNSGDNDPDVGKAIEKGLTQAYRAAPAGSPASEELDLRLHILSGAVSRMDCGESVINWWDGHGNGCSSGHCSGNLSVA